MVDVLLESAASERRSLLGTIPADGTYAEGTAFTLCLLAVMLCCLTRLLRCSRQEVNPAKTLRFSQSLQPHRYCVKIGASYPILCKISENWTKLINTWDDAAAVRLQ